MSRGLLPRRFALHLVRVGRRYPKTVIVGAAMAWLIAGGLATRLEVDTDILSLVPRGNAVVDAFTTTIDRFGSVDTLLVAVRIEQEHDLEGVLEFSNRLAESLRAWKLIDWLEYRIEMNADAAVPLLDRATLLLGLEEVDKLLDRLEGDALEAEAERLHARLLTPQSLVTKDYLRHDPLGLLPKLLDRARFSGVGVTVDPETGCLIDPERRLLLMIAKPVRPAQDLDFDKRLLRGLERHVAEVSEAWTEEGWPDDPPPVEFTGGHIITLADSELITSDSLVGLVSSMAGVLLLFLVAFRRPATLAYAFFPLVTGIGLTLIFVALCLGRLNSLTSASGGLLIGLGIDFIIVLYGRYVEERRRGVGHAEAVDTLGEYTGIGVLLGAVTTAATFFAFLVTDFRGLSELGLLTGTGILLLMVSTFLLLPALLTVFFGRRSTLPRLTLHSFGSDLLCRISVKRPRMTLLTAAGVTVGLAVAAFGLRFDDDFRNMRSPHNRGAILRQEVMDAFGLRFSPMMVRVDGRDEGEALGRARQILPELEQLVDGENLASIDTIAGVVPAEEEQWEVIRQLETAAPRLEGLRERLQSRLRDAGLNPAAFELGIDHLIAALAVRQPLALTELRDSALARVVDRYVARFEDGVSTVIYCYPPAGRWRRQAPPRLVSLVGLTSHAFLASPIVVSAELRRIVWGDAARAAVLGIIVVFLLMWADLGSPLRSLLALAPLMVGVVWMLGAMALLKVSINFMNIFVLTMIIGIGVDYGVHLLHRWLESGGDPAALSETSKAIGVAALTTMVGFGSLVLSHFPGLRSVGAAAILGALATALASITVLPVLLSKLRV